VYQEDTTLVTSNPTSLGDKQMQNTSYVSTNDYELFSTDDGLRLALFDDYIKDCALGSDEVGNLLFCESAIADFVQQDSPY